MDDAELKDLRDVLKHMESPFGFIQGFQMERKVVQNVEERQKDFEDHKKDVLVNWEITPDMQKRLDNMQVQEKAVEKKIDSVSTHIAERMGYREMPWLRLTWYLLWIYTGLTVMIMMKREDFINLTICVVAIYMMFNTDTISRIRFRGLVFAIIVSLVMDLLWFVVKHYEYASDGQSDGGLEGGIRKTVLMLSYISFIIRVRTYINILMIDCVDTCCNSVLEGFNGLQ